MFLSFVEPHKLNTPKKPDQQDPPPRCATWCRHLFISTGPSRGARSSNDPTRGSGGQRLDKPSREQGLLLRELCAGPAEYPDGWFDPS